MSSERYFQTVTKSNSTQTSSIFKYEYQNNTIQRSILFLRKYTKHHRSLNMIAARVTSVPVKAMISPSSSSSSFSSSSSSKMMMKKRSNNNIICPSAQASDWDTFSIFLRKQCESAAKEGDDSKKWDDVRAINPDAKSVFYQKFPSSPSSSSKETDTGWDSGMDDFCDGNEDAAECKVFD